MQRVEGAGIEMSHNFGVRPNDRQMAAGRRDQDSPVSHLISFLRFAHFQLRQFVQALRVQFGIADRHMQHDRNRQREIPRKTRHQLF